MKKLEDLNWKGFYAEEMADRRQEISERVMREWEVEDPEVLRVLEKGGALSFPHTYLESNLEPVMRTVRAIYRSGKGSVVALGVFHRLNGENLESEYSLDTFRSLLDIAEETLGLPKLKVNAFFLPRVNISLKDPESAVRTFETEKDSILGSMGEDSALVLTGDLTHYGYGYGTPEPVQDPGDLVAGWVRGSLDALYLEKDYPKYIELSKRSLNDQIVPGIITSMFLGEPLEYRIFSSTISDYSGILGKRSPTVVASVFYGVNPR